jgi:glucosamine--fructose-6-phosphate aminotransferase (isomerizing)
MCGIIGYIGPKQAEPILIEGLKKLEYRGYDSAGVAVYDGGKLTMRKKKGRLSVLESFIAEHPVEGSVGIGHTRWATHGEPSDVNSHPHANTAGDIALVHNGIIENYARLKQWLGEKGYEFVSQTDTEVVVQLVDYFYKDDLLEAVREALSHVQGSYAIAVVSSRHPGELIAARKDSPLILGKGRGENFIASDIPAILAHTREIYLLEDRETARITAGGIEIFDEYGSPVRREIFHVHWDVSAAEKGGYPHFMLKEIHEEPKALRDTLSPRFKDEMTTIDLSEAGLSEDAIRAFRRVVVVACGTAYHAGMVSKYAFERMLGLPVEVDMASEFRYRDPTIQKGELFIAISQSGETADTLAAMRLARARGAFVLAITNVVGSTVSREAGAVMYTWAGPEIAVASTKAFTTQLLCLYMLMLEMGRIRGAIGAELYARLASALRKLPEQAAEILAQEEEIARSAHLHYAMTDTYFLGRNLDYAISLEGSLKLKEISYIHSEAFAAGELKHGPIALIEQGTLVIALATQPPLYEKLASNIKEVKARGAVVLSICPADAELIRELSDEVFLLPKTEDVFMPALAVIPTQLFAYHCSVERGFDVDKPRNLAKSVTVE